MAASTSTATSSSRTGCSLKCAPGKRALGSSEAYVYSRFNSASHDEQLGRGRPLQPLVPPSHPRPVGHALLIHGLTDSPYSMKALAETLHGEGFEVTVLGCPGTAPSFDDDPDELPRLDRRNAHRGARRRVRANRASYSTSAAIRMAGRWR